MSDQHSSPIKTPKQLVTIVILAFIVPVFIIALLVKYVTGQKTESAGANAMTPEAIADRLAPVGVVAYQGSPAAGGAPKTGEAVYTQACAACHATGAAGSPKFGDASAWGPRNKQGFDTLVKHAIEGFKGMPAKGGNSALSDVEVARAVAYMANAAGASFKEPAAPAAPAQAAGGADAGKKLYDASCQACHGAGVAGAPKFGDKAAWAARIKQGNDTLLKHAIDGFKGMPAKGGSSAPDAEIKAAVEYMVNASK